jgi:hypothetical protein
MNRSFFRLFVGAIVTLGVCLGSVSSVQALSLAPSILEIQANPGETKTVVVSLTNDESEPVRIESTIQKFIPLGTGGQQQFLSPEDTSGLPSWTFVGAIAGGLQPGERQNVTIQIRVPSDASRGGAYEAIFFSARPLAEATAGTVGLRSKIGALILLTVGDTTQAELAVSDWRLLEAGTQSSLSGTARLTLKNVGRTHATPKGELVVRNMLGGVVLRLPVNPLNARILPASERTFEVSFGSEASSGWMGQLKNELVAFGVGRYQISLEGMDGLSQGESLQMTVLPWRVIGSGALLVLLLVCAFRLYRSYLIKALQAQRP